MALYYTDEKQTQVLIALLKANGIKRVIASPGTTNMSFVGSIQNDSYFEVYSSVDERSAAYLACGIAAESNEPVVLSCTGATASRNYMSGLTEAFYRKLPILAVTSHQGRHKIGHNIAQVIDRSVIPNDVAKFSIELPIVKDDEDLWDCEIKVNKAISELTRHGGGPVHINLQTTYSKNFNVEKLPEYRIIKRYATVDELPNLPKGRIAIFVGSHQTFDKELTEAIDKFCAIHNAVVFCDHTSNYHGNFRILGALAAGQEKLYMTDMHVDVLIHIGNISGDYLTSLTFRAKEVWRVNEDGEMRDLFKKLVNVFEMPEKVFFKAYGIGNVNNNEFYKTVKDKVDDIRNSIPELPFSNAWIASKMANRIPSNSIIHFAILNSLRTWNFFELPTTVRAYTNVGGFGIDGCLSSFVGASLINKNNLSFCVIGDLAFFYDMNVLGNRHIPNNMRILVVNNGTGQEFRNFNHSAAQFGDSANEFIAAGGHFGNKSQTLIRDYVQNLGFEYFQASTTDDCIKYIDVFLDSKIKEKPILLEIYTNDKDESEALRKLLNTVETLQGRVKDAAKQLLGDKGFSALRKMMKK